MDHIHEFQLFFIVPCSKLVRKFSEMCGSYENLYSIILSWSSWIIYIDFLWTKILYINDGNPTYLIVISCFVYAWLYNLLGIYTIRFFFLLFVIVLINFWEIISWNIIVGVDWNTIWKYTFLFCFVMFYAITFCFDLFQCPCNIKNTTKILCCHFLLKKWFILNL